MRIGILTYHRAKNYGAYLQAYGLCSRLNQENDIKAEIIDFHMAKECRKYTLNKSLWFKIRNNRWYSFLKRLYASFDKGIKELPLSEQYLCSDSIDEFKAFVQGKYDVIIAGSDEIWKYDSFRSFPTPYWLPGDLKCKKVSYAASSRSVFDKDERILSEIKKYLRDFSIISVRDNKTLAEVKNVIDKNQVLMLSPDPSLVYHYDINKAQGRKILQEKLGVQITDKVAIIMTEDAEVGKKIKKEISDEYRLISLFHRHKGYANLSELTPFEWVDVLACADFVITSYFHATCFSIRADVPFLCIATEAKKSKLNELLEQSKDVERLITVEDIEQEGVIKKALNRLNNKQDHTEFLKKCEADFNVFLEQLKKL